MANAADSKSQRTIRRPGYQRWLRLQSLGMQSLCVGFTVVILATLILVTGFLIYEGVQNLSIDFFTEDQNDNPFSKDFPGGMKHAIVGTGILVGLASLIGIPIGVLAGIYLAEYSSGSRFAGPVRFIADVLTGVPSIVVGMVGYTLIVKQFGGYDGYAGALALAFIIIPIIARTTEEMLRLVPRSYREASVALGATKARTILRVVLPAASGSVITGVMLAVARIAGETAPLLFTSLGGRVLTVNPAEPMPALSTKIYEYAMGNYPRQYEMAWAGMLVLVGLIFVVNLTVRFTVYRMQVKKLG